MAGTHGGTRPGAGRKTNAERAARALREQLREHKLFEISEQEEKAYWAKVKADALEGKRDAQKLLAEYLYGRPSQKQHEQLDPVINLWTSFRGQPYVCLKCHQEDKERNGGDGRASPVRVLQEDRGASGDEAVQDLPEVVLQAMRPEEGLPRLR